MSTIASLQYIHPKKGPLFPSLSYYPNTSQLQEEPESHARQVPGWSSPKRDAMALPTPRHSAVPPTLLRQPAWPQAPSPPADTPSAAAAAAAPASAHRPNPSAYRLFAATFPDSTGSPRAPRKLGTPPQVFSKASGFGHWDQPFLCGGWKGDSKTPSVTNPSAHVCALVTQRTKSRWFPIALSFNSPEFCAGFGFTPYRLET